jgi:hypothetical protein
MLENLYSLLRLEFDVAFGVEQSQIGWDAHRAAVSQEGQLAALKLADTFFNGRVGIGRRTGGTQRREGFLNDTPDQSVINPVVFVSELIAKTDDSWSLIDAGEQAAVDTRQMISASPMVMNSLSTAVRIRRLLQSSTKSSQRCCRIMTEEAAVPLLAVAAGLRRRCARRGQD